MSGTLFQGFSAEDLPVGTSLYSGKARDIIDLGDRLLITEGE
jgi:hypothetical protein